MLSTLLSLLNGRVRRVLGVVVLVAAVLLFAGAILSTVTSLNLRANGVKTNAAVVSVSPNFSRTSAHTYTDLVEFTTPDGKQHRDSISGSRGDRIGQTVAVVYDPSDPNTMQTASSLTGLWWITPVVLLLFSFLFGWLGRRLWRVRQPARQEQEQEVTGNLF